MARTLLHRVVWVPTANKIGVVVEEDKKFVSVKFGVDVPWVKVEVERVHVVKTFCKFEPFTHYKVV